MNKYKHIKLDQYCNEIEIYQAGLHLLTIKISPKSLPWATVIIPAAFFDYFSRDNILSGKNGYKKFLKEVNQKLKDFNINAIAIGINQEENKNVS